MKSYLFLITLIALSSARLYSQQSSGQVELPSFVITGEEKYELPKADKQDAPFVPVVSDVFLRPVFSPEYLETSLQSDPLTKRFRLQDTIRDYNTKMESYLGNYQLPAFSFTTIIPRGSYSLLTALDGYNQRPYDPNTERYVFFPKLGVKYKVVQEGSFFNDNEIYAESGYNFASYKLYGLSSPLERKLNNIYMKADISSSKGNFWQYGVHTGYNVLKLTDESTRESDFNVSAEAGISGANFEFMPKGEFKHLATANVQSSQRLNLIHLSAPFQIKLSDVISLNAGFDFTSIDTVRSLSPMASIGIKVANGIMFFGGYNTHYEVRNLHDALSENNFISLDKFVPLYYPLSNRIQGGMTVEYEKFFDVSLGFARFSSENYPYYHLDTASRKYTPAGMQVKGMQMNADLRVYPSRYGYCFASLLVQAVRNDSDKYIPFVPFAKGYFGYGYTILEGFNGKTGVTFLGGRYTDEANNFALKDNLSIFFELGYSFSQDLLLTLKVNNLLSRQNYNWQYYKEMPFELTTGIFIQW